MQFLSKYGVARHLYVPITKVAVKDFALAADWTPAAGDVKISKDGGAAANVTNLPVAITMGNTAMWDFSLTATEMQAKQVMVTVADSAAKAVEDALFAIETYGNASAQHALDLGTATINPGAGGITSSSFAAGAVNAAAIAADAIGASELAADAVTEIVTGVWAKAIAELSAVPGTTASVLEVLEWLFTLARNKRVQTSTTETVYKNDGTTPIASSTKSDASGTFTRNKYA